jgi:hypothetical protein
MDIRLERGDEFPYRPEVYTAGRVQDGHDEFDGIVFAVLARGRPCRARASGLEGAEGRVENRPSA